MSIAHQYTADGFYYGSMEDGGFPPNNSTYTAPPPWPWKRQWPRWNGRAWEMVEDHRERAMPGLEQHATDYWLPGDTHETPARHMTKPGPLPDGALLVKPAAPEPTPEEQQAAMQKAFTDAIQARLDAFAQSRGYDSIMSACSYFGSANPRFKAEADAAIRLRDETWAACYAILEAVLAGDRPAPTLEALFAELPPLEW